VNSGWLGAFLRQWRLFLYLILLATAAALLAAEPIQSSNLHNAFIVTPRIFSGSAPNNEAGFAEIVKLGVKTIISVDGAKPDLEGAKKFGLIYIHIPFGYDGIPSNRLAQLVKAAQVPDGPVYVHCHHGLHRGPAAVAVMCEAVAGWSTNTAEEWLKQAGTSADYPGLYRSAREFKPPTLAELSAVKELPEVTETSSLVETMVVVDEHFSRLQTAQKAGWKSAPDHPDIEPAHEATLLWEAFREMARQPDTARRLEDYRAKLSEAEKAANQHRALLKQSSTNRTEADSAFKQIGQSCAQCHKSYRN
jgi:protein tyrosine phosphatase (PTP) superfamily phosphohydrolase (DUF442 family)